MRGNRVTLVGARYAMSAEDAMRNNRGHTRPSASPCSWLMIQSTLRCSANVAHAIHSTLRCSTLTMLSTLQYSVQVSQCSVFIGHEECPLGMVKGHFGILIFLFSFQPSILLLRPLIQMQRAVWEVLFRRFVIVFQCASFELGETRFGADVTEGGEPATLPWFHC